MIKVFYDPKNVNNDAEKTCRITCENCGCVFNCEKEDVLAGEHRRPYVMCPSCGDKAYFDCKEFEKNITPENLVYPDDFWMLDSDTAYHVTDNELRGMIKDVVRMAATKKDYFYFTQYGDRMVMTLLGDDNVLCVNVLQPIAATKFCLK